MIGTERFAARSRSMYARRRRRDSRLRQACLVDTEARLDAVLSELSKAPAVLHVATHGLFGDSSSLPRSRGGQLRRQLSLSAENDPLARCALLLSGTNDKLQLLTARHLAILDLSPVSLAVLSACDTGIGLADAAEGVLGFQAALHHAGVATVVTSLWPIDDAISPAIMEDFHRALRGGERPSAALRKAQMRWSRTNGPHDWGGLTISGSDAPLVFDAEGP